jgi:hypothetical protein
MSDRPDSAGGNGDPNDNGSTGTDEPNGNGPDNGAPPADDKPATGTPNDGGNGGSAGDDGTDWKGRSRTWEDRAKQNKTAAEQAARERDEANATLAAVRKAFGLDGADEEDPKTAAEKAARERDEKDAELRTLRLERAAEKAGRKAGADVDALLDSRSFANAVAKLDPTDDGFDDDLAALVDKALDSNPRLKAEKPTPPPSTTDMTGGGEQGKAADPDDIDSIREARRKRRNG